MVVELVLRLLHIVPAIFLAGGVFFMWAALVPALGAVSDEARASVLEAVRGKWSKVVMACSGMLLVSGLINAVRNIIGFEYTTPYHIFVTLKLLLALGILFITARLSGRSEGAAKFRENLSFWMTVNTILLFLVIGIASTMRVSDRTPKQQDDRPAAASQLVDPAN